MQTAFITHRACLKHDVGSHHPESPPRHHATRDRATGFCISSNVAAEESTQGRIVSVLEGGYALPALGRSAAGHIRALGGL